ncbi:hypothetical protein BOTBODRAFT_225028 [Botryobasidium botryosum FD-172 SS1]|uniref:Uncharacterized protein n=1 Tax=Botryobasidium botryosum (strain FD-172 SS1) TaxID=930990 RepID=A0A067MNH1_BOTB1|nr:hypothetical protein BOTBODRAFT_225028 [Botryobasidium botryosum FD-172 SS1]
MRGRMFDGWPLPFLEVRAGVLLVVVCGARLAPVLAVVLMIVLGGGKGNVDGVQLAKWLEVYFEGGLEGDGGLSVEFEGGSRLRLN